MMRKYFPPSILGSFYSSSKSVCIGNKQVTIFPLQRHVAAEENSFFSRESNNGWRENSMHSLFDAYRAAAASP